MCFAGMRAGPCSRNAVMWVQGLGGQRCDHPRPAWQVRGFGAVAQNERRLQPGIRIAFHLFGADATAKKVGPQKFREGRGVLGEAAGVAHFPARLR